MILTCAACYRQIVSREKTIDKESRTSSTEAQCTSCGTIYRVDLFVLRETILTPEQLKQIRNKTT